MTKPRINVDRKLYGIIGKVRDGSKLQSAWNAWLEQHDIDGFADRYPTSVDMIPERLSEMFHFDRKLYVIAPDLRREVATYLDRFDHDEPDVIVNERGVLHGVRIGIDDMEIKAMVDALMSLRGER